MAFSYLSTAEDTSFYPPADVNVTMGPMQTPQIYAKDMNVLEIGSSGQVVMSLQDQASVSFSNNDANTITYVSGVNNNAIHIQPEDLLSTTLVGDLQVDSSGQWQELSSTQVNGIYWKDPVRLASTLNVLDTSTFKRTLDVCGATVLWSTLSVYDRATFSGPVAVRGDAAFSSDLNAQSTLTSLGPVSLQSNLSVQGNTLFRQTLDICGNVALSNNLSIAPGGGMRVDNVTAGEVNVNSITSTGTIAFGNEVVMLQGLDIFGQVEMASHLDVYGSVTLNRTMDVCGSVELWSTLSVASTTFLSGSLQVNGSAAVSGAISVSSTLSVAGAVTLMGPVLNASGSMTLGSSLSLQGTLDVANVSQLGNTLSVSSGTFLKGSVTADGTLTVRDDMIVRTGGSLSVTSDANFQNALYVQGTTSILAEQTGFQNMYYVHTGQGYLVSSATYGYTAAWSVSFWMRYTSSATTCIPFDSRTLTPEVDGFAIVMTSTLTLLPGAVSYPSTLHDQKWHFVTVSRETNRVVVYEDGQQKTTRPTDIAPNQMMTRPKFGSSQQNSINTAQNLYFDEISIFNTALTSTQVLSMYNGGNPQDVRTVATPVSYWRLESVQNGNQVPDLMGFSTLDHYVETTATNLTLSSYNPSISPAGANTMSLYVSGTTANQAYLANNLTMVGMLTVDGSANVQKSIDTDMNLSVDGTSTFVGKIIDIAYYSTQSMVFNGTAKAVASTPFDRSNLPFSISFWFKANPGNVLSPDRPKLFDGRWLTDNSSTIELSNTTSISVWGGGWVLNWTDYQWHHVMVTTNGVNSINRYIDGQFVGSGVFASKQLVLSSVTLGSRYADAGDPSHWFHGYMDEVGIFDTQLTEPQVAEMYGQGRAVNLLTSSAGNNLLAYWNMEGNGTNSVGTNHLTLTNTTFTNTTTATSTIAPLLGDPTALILRSPMDVSGAMRLGSSLSVYDSVALNSTLIVKGGVDANGSVDVASSITVRDGTTYLESTLSVTGTCTLRDTLDVSGATRLWSTLSVHNTTRFESGMQVSGHTELASSLSVGGTMDVNGIAPVILSSTLTTAGAGYLASTLDVSGFTLVRNTLSVGGTMDVCGNVKVGGTASVQGSTTLQSTVVAASTLAVANSATFATEVKSDFYRPLPGNVPKVMTIDASKTIISGNVDVVGTFNTINTVNTMLVQDNSFTLSTDPSGGKHVDGTFVNHTAGLYVDGLPSGVATDPSNLYEKSFS
jgi:hypothetical protein